jgi:hypothetical protein
LTDQRHANISRAQVLIVRVTGSGYGEHYKAFAQEHYNRPGDFFWGQLTFSCHCDRNIDVEPTPTQAANNSLTTMPTKTSLVSPYTERPVAPIHGDFDMGIAKCMASNSGSGRQCHPLVGQIGTKFGQVCVEVVDDDRDPNDKVRVTYEVYGDYRMTRKYLWLGDSPNSQVPVMTGEEDSLEPDLDAFPHYSW